MDTAAAVKGKYRELSAKLDSLAADALGGEIAHIYNPLSYARGAWETYVDRYCPPEGGAVLFLGMNPGPDGMAQTGIPFGAVPCVREYLGISGGVEAPPRQHPRKPVLGFASPRVEPSGKRLWGLVEELFPSAAELPKHFFVLNHCPLLFLAESGRNIALPSVPVSKREAIVALCDTALAATIRILRPRALVGVGVWAEATLHRALLQAGAAPETTGDTGETGALVAGNWAVLAGGEGAEVAAKDATPVFRLAHPSPASPTANRGWRELALPVFAELGLVSRSGR